LKIILILTLLSPSASLSLQVLGDQVAKKLAERLYTGFDVGGKVF